MSIRPPPVQVTGTILEGAGVTGHQFSPTRVGNVAREDQVHFEVQR